MKQKRESVVPELSSPHGKAGATGLRKRSFWESSGSNQIFGGGVELSRVRLHSERCDSNSTSGATYSLSVRYNGVDYQWRRT